MCGLVVLFVFVSDGWCDINEYGAWVCIGKEGRVKDLWNIGIQMKLDGILGGLMVD